MLRFENIATPATAFEVTRAHNCTPPTLVPSTPFTACVAVGTKFPWASFFNDTATTEIYTLALHDALPILNASFAGVPGVTLKVVLVAPVRVAALAASV